MNSYDADTGDHYRIDTPERVDLDYDIASLGTRLMATIVDTFLLVVLYALLWILGDRGLREAAGLLEAAAKALGASLGPVAVTAVAIAGLVLLTFGVFWGYYVSFEMAWHGQSPGKRWVGLRVIREGGYPVGLAESAVRNLVRFVDFLPGFYAIGVLTMFVDRRSRRLGDLAAGTLVVRERRDVRLDSLGLPPRAATASPADVEMLDPFPNAYLLTSAERSLLREYLLRRPTLSEEAAAKLASQLAVAFANRMGYDMSTETPEAFLLRLASHTGVGQR